MIKLYLVLFIITLVYGVNIVSTETKLKHGINTIKLQHHDGTIKSHDIFVDAETDDNNWIVIQRRINNELNFNRSWHEYKSGFGDLEQNFWMGNDALSAMTSRQPAILRIDLTDCNHQQAFQIYKGFSVLPEKYNYRVQISDSNSEGNAGDSLLMSGNGALGDYSINGMSFSTIDKDNDNFCGSCSEMKGGGGFWYNKCSGANLNGIYYNNCQYTSPVLNGIDWFTWNAGREPYSLYKVEMKISWQEYLPSTFSPLSRSTSPPTTSSYCSVWYQQCQQECMWNPYEPWCRVPASNFTANKKPKVPRPEAIRVTAPAPNDDYSTTPNCYWDPYNWQCQQECQSYSYPWCSTTTTASAPSTTPDCNFDPWSWQCQQQCNWYPWEPWCPTQSTQVPTTSLNCYGDPWNWECQQQCNSYPWPWCSTTATTSTLTTTDCYIDPWTWQCQQQCSWNWEPWCLTTTTLPTTTLPTTITPFPDCNMDPMNWECQQCNEYPWNWQCQQQCNQPPWYPTQPWCSTTTSSSTMVTSTWPNCYVDPRNWQCQQCSSYPWYPWCPSTTPSPMSTFPTQMSTTSINCYYNPWDWQCQQQCMWYPWEPWCPTSSTSSPTQASTTTLDCYNDPGNWQCQQQCNWNPWQPWCSSSPSTTQSSISQQTTPTTSTYCNDWYWQQCQQECNWNPNEPWCNTRRGSVLNKVLKNSKLDKNLVASKQKAKNVINKPVASKETLNASKLKVLEAILKKPAAKN